MLKKLALVWMSALLLTARPAMSHAQQLAPSVCRWYGLAESCTVHDVRERAARMATHRYVPDGTRLGRSVGDTKSGTGAHVPTDTRNGTAAPRARAVGTDAPHGLMLYAVPTTPVWR